MIKGGHMRKITKTKIIISLMFALFGCIILVFTSNPPEIFTYFDDTWKIATYFVGFFCIVASLYTLFYKGE